MNFQRSRAAADMAAEKDRYADRLCVGCFLCNGMTEPAVVALSGIAESRRVSAGDEIPFAAAGSYGLCGLRKGLVMLQRALVDGRRQVLSFCHGGDVMHPLGGVAKAQAVALTDVEVCLLPGEALDGVARRHPEIACRLADIAASRVGALAERIVALGRMTAGERWAGFLLEMAERTGRPTPDGIEFTLPMSREDIADYLGLNVETVSRNLTRLKKKELIRLPKPTRTIVPDLAGLAAETPALGT